MRDARGSTPKGPHFGREQTVALCQGAYRPSPHNHHIRHGRGVCQPSAEACGGRRRPVRRPRGISLGKAQLTRSRVTVLLVYVWMPKA